MKKLKLLPTILMLVLCVGILAIGIYAVKPTENNISGSITVNASNAEVKLELLQNGVVTQTYESVRGGVTFKKLSLEFDTEEANVLSDVEDIKYTIRITNKSSTSLGAYFFNPSSTLPDDKIALGDNVLYESTINTNGDSPEKLADVTLGGYAYVPADQTKSVELDVTMTLSKLFDTTVTGDFEYILNIEPYECTDGFSYIDDGGFFATYSGSATSLMKLPEILYDETYAPNGLTPTVFPGYGLSSSIVLKHVVVPSCYTTISSFNGYTNLVSIDMQTANITSVENSAFSGCSKLANINLKNVNFGTSLPEKIFYGCSSLKSIDLSNSNITTIGNSAFSGCTSLETIDFGDSVVTSIGEGAFAGCTSLKNLKLTLTSSDGKLQAKDGVLTFLPTIGTSIPDYMLTDDTYPEINNLMGNVINEIEISEGITTIGSNIFSSSKYYYDLNLSRITLPSTLTNVDPCAFSNSYIGHVYFDEVVCDFSGEGWTFINGQLNITSSTFSGFGNDLVGLGNLISGRYVVPSHVTTINGTGFRYFSCDKIILPDGLKTMTSRVLGDYVGLKEIYIPSSVEVIDAYLYSYQDSYEITYYCGAASKPTGWHENWAIYQLQSDPETVASVSWNVERPDWAK